MAAPSLLFPPSEAPSSRDFATEAALHRVRVAAMTARDRLAEIEGVRVLGPEVSGDAGAVRLAIDLRDTASHRVIIVRLREEDIAEGIHERIAPALLMGLWATPPAPADEPEPPAP